MKWKLGDFKLKFFYFTNGICHRPPTFDITLFYTIITRKKVKYLLST